MISKQTAMDIAFAHREIDTADELLKEIDKAKARFGEAPDVLDAFGRLHGGLQLGIPSGDSSHRLFNVPWPLAKVVIEAHIASQRQILSALNAKAAIEAQGQPTAEG